MMNPVSWVVQGKTGFSIRKDRIYTDSRLSGVTGQVAIAVYNALVYLSTRDLMENVNLVYELSKAARLEEATVSIGLRVLKRYRYIDCLDGKDTLIYRIK